MTTVASEAWLRNQAISVRSAMTTSVLWSFGSGLLIIIQARLLATICHNTVINGFALSQTMPLLLYLAATAVLRGTAGYLGEHAALNAAATVKQTVRVALYRKLLLLKPSGIAGDTGALSETVTSGVEGLDHYISKFLPQMILAGLIPAAILFTVIPSEWRGSLVLIFSAPFIPLLMILIGKGTEALNRRQWDRLSRMSGHLLDLVQGLPDLKAAGVAKKEAETVATVSEQYRSSTMAVLRVAFLSALTLEFFSTVGTAVVAVIIGFRLLAGNLPLLDGLFVLLLAPEFYLPLRNLGLAYHSRMNGMAAAAKIIPLLEHPVPDQENPENIRNSITGIPPEICCCSVSFRYEGGRGGVDDINLKLVPGSITALAGTSGSGKSTLARLLLGLTTPQSGKITVNGTDLSRLNRQEWQSRLAWVSQEPFFFNATIRDNLLTTSPVADETIRQVFQAVALSEVIERLPDGLDTCLGDQGAGLSGGELRRLALARVFLRDPMLVVLDEPTAGLDAENEQLVLDAMEQLASGRTMLVISHREATINRCHQVAVLEAGRLLQVVTPGTYLAATI